MYRNKKLSFSDVGNIKKIFPEIDKLIKDYEGLDYQQLAISIFPHWLTIEEANVLLDNISNNMERIRTIKLQQFIVSLCKEFNCYLIVSNKKRQIFEYQKVTSKEQIKVLHSMIPNSGRVKLVIPSLKAVYFEGCDFTHFLYYQKRKKLSRFEHLVKKKGLYII